MAKTVSPIKVAADGTVTRDGTVIGSVERTRKDTSIYAAIGGYDGPVRWIPKDIDGNPITGHRNTRRDAVRIVEQYARPLTVSVSRQGDLWHADVAFQGNSLGATRADGESHWFVHFIWTTGAIIPRLSTLAGTRPAQAIVRPDVVNALNEAANEKGASFPLVPMA